MFKVISMIFSPTPESAEPEEMEAVRGRMARMRARTTSQNLQALKLPEPSPDSSINTQEITGTDIISRGRDVDPSKSSGAFTFRGKEERARRLGSLARDWQDRVSHLPGFEVDPHISQE
ncbi:MAG: hypothetical protein AB7W16_26805 [Candidatus Obscuribacterales bacterium]